MLNILFAFIFSADEACKVRPHSGLVDTLVGFAEETRNLANYFGFETNTTFPDVLNDEDYEPYLASVAGLAVPFVVITALLIVYFVLGQLFACCPCCHAANSRSINCRSAGMFIGVSILLLISAGIFFAAASAISGSFTEFAKIPANVLKSTDSVIDTVNSTVEDAFNLINTTLNNGKGVLQGFVDFIGDGLNDTIGNATETKNHLSTFRDIFYHSTTDTLFQTHAKDFDTLLNGNCPPSSDLYQATVDFSSVANDIVNSAQQMIDAFSNINTLTADVQTLLDSSLSDIQDEIDSFKDQISNYTNPITNVRANISDYIDEYGFYLDLVNSNVKNVIYGVVSFMLAISLIYLMFYFCNNCLARCIVSFFWTCGFILTVIIILPSAVFSVIFYLFYDVCPLLEPTLDQFANSSLDFFPETSSISSILLCNGTEKSLYKLAGLEEFLNYTDIIEDLRGEVSSMLTQLIVPADIYDQIGNATSINTTQMFNNEYLFNNVYDFNALKGQVNDPGLVCVDSTQKATLIGHLDSMENIMTSSKTHLDDAKIAADLMLQFATQVIPKVDATKNITANLIDDFLDGALELLGEKIDEIDCSLICSIYVPFRNALCSYLVDGMAFWLTSSLCTIIGITVMSVLLIQRRKSMLPPKVEDTLNDDYGYGYDYDDEPYDRRRYPSKPPRHSRNSKQPRRHRRH